MPSEGILTAQQERAISSILDRVRRAKPRVKMLEALGRPDPELELRLTQLEQSCVGAIELNELAKAGEA